MSLMEREDNPAAGGFKFPPGFRFHPSDEELMVHYLQNKVTSRPVPASVIADIDLYKYNPWELPKRALFGEDEWYFFSPRDRKYPNGERPNRAAGSGYWKATGTDKPILSSVGSKNLGVKKALVFYAGRPPKGVKTDWMMNEYRLVDTIINPSKSKGSMRLDDWVLCRLRFKSGNMMRNSTCQIHDTTTAQRAGLLVNYYSQNGEMVHPAYLLNHNDDVIRDRILSSSQPSPPPIETVSSLISFQGSNNGNSFNPAAAYEEGGGASDNKGNSPSPPSPTVSSKDTYLNPLKRNLGDDDDETWYVKNMLPSKKKPICCDNKDLLGFPFSKALPNNYYSQCQELRIYTDPSSDGLIDFQELNECLSLANIIYNDDDEPLSKGQ